MTDLPVGPAAPAEEQAAAEEDECCGRRSLGGCGVVSRTNLSGRMTECLTDHPMLRYCSSRAGAEQQRYRPGVGMVVPQRRSSRTFDDCVRGKRLLRPEQASGVGNVLTYDLPTRRDDQWKGIVRLPGACWGRAMQSSICVGDNMLAPVIEHDLRNQRGSASLPFCHMNSFSVSEPPEPRWQLARTARGVADFSYAPRQYPGEIDAQGLLRGPPPACSAMHADNSSSADRGPVYQPDDYYRSTDQRLWYGQANARHQQQSYVDELKYARINFTGPLPPDQYELDYTKTQLPRPGKGPDDFHRPMRSIPQFSPAGVEADEKEQDCVHAEPQQSAEGEPLPQFGSPAHHSPAAGPRHAAPAGPKRPAGPPVAHERAPAVSSPELPPAPNPSPEPSRPESPRVSPLKLDRSPLAPAEEAPAPQGEPKFHTMASQITPPQMIPTGSDSKERLSSSAKAGGLRTTFQQQRAKQQTAEEEQQNREAEDEWKESLRASGRSGRRVFESTSTQDLIDPTRRLYNEGLDLNTMGLEDAKRAYQVFMKTHHSPEEPVQRRGRAVPRGRGPNPHNFVRQGSGHTSSDGALRSQADQHTGLYGESTRTFSKFPDHEPAASSAPASDDAKAAAVANAARGNIWGAKSLAPGTVMRAREQRQFVPHMRGTAVSEQDHVDAVGRFEDEEDEADEEDAATRSSRLVDRPARRVRLWAECSKSFFNDHGVYLNIYDMSHGYARRLSPLLLGRRMPGVWHTGVEVFGREYFYGGGVYKIVPGEISRTMGLTLSEKRFLGTTKLERREFEDFLCEIKPLFNESTYNLLAWNCNHFSDTLAKFLVGGGIGNEFLELGQQIRSSFVGRCLANCLMAFQQPPAAPPV